MTNEEVEQMMADCEAREGRLTDWERGFLDSIRNYLDRGGFLSERQSEKLERIWDRVTEAG